MSMTVTMPKLGESVTEGTIARWIKQPGEQVERYEAIAEVVTDKVNAEIPAPAEGVMGRHIVDEGAVVPVGEPICVIEGAGEAGGVAAAAEQAQPAEPAPAAATSEAAARSEEEPSAAAREAAPPQTAAPPASAPVRQSAGEGSGAPAPAPVVPVGGDDGAGEHVTPAVRMLAREHGVDLSAVHGSGIGGRVTKKDVLEFVQRRDASGAPARPQAAAPAPAAAAPAAAQAATPAPARPAAPAVEAPGGDSLVPLTPVRRAIAEHMVRSRRTSPHAWTMVEVDMTTVARVRAREKERFRQQTGANLTFLPFVARAVIGALRRYPTLNSSWTDDGILVHRDVNLGIAVALEDNLIVPVIRQADRLSLAGLAQAMQDLGERARASRLRVDELNDGTFTLNNTGALGAVMTQSIINQPQAAILAMDAVVKRPVVVEGDAIAVRSMMNLCISFDHRIVDGLQGTRFLQAVRQALESLDDTTAMA